MEEDINSLVSECLNHKRGLIRSVRNKMPLPEVIKNKLNDFSQSIVSFVEDIDNYEIIEDKDFAAARRITATSLYETKETLEWAENHYQQQLRDIDRVHVWAANGGFNGVSTLLTNSGAFSSATPVKKRCDQILEGFNLTNVQQDYIRAIKSLGGYVPTDTFKANFKRDFIKGKFQETIESEDKRPNSILQQGSIKAGANIATSRLAPLAGHLDSFLPCAVDGFQEIQASRTDILNIEEAFSSKLLESHNRIMEPHVSRTTLPIMFTHIVASCPEYLASLRLTNRSALHSVRNQANDTSIFGTSKETNQDFGWQFPASETSVAIERTRITKNARSAIIPMQTGSNAYDDIISKINMITRIKYDVEEEEKRITDKDVARWVRQVIQCQLLDFSTHDNPETTIIFSAKEQKDLSLFIVQLAHLLGGTEAMRYPGAIVANQMAIDLILDGKLTWAEALNPSQAAGRFIPMTMEGATNISRTLITTYSQHNPYRYSYTGDADKDGIRGENINTFTAAENRLTTSWLEMVTERKKKAEGKKEASIDLKDAVRDSISGWYPGL